MTGSKKLAGFNLKNILIFGSGRWSKEYIKTLLEFKNLNLTIFIFTSTKNSTLYNWLKKNSYEKKVFFISDLNLIKKKKFDACFVVNDTKNHFERTKFAISRNIPVLVEKPVSENFQEIKKLLILAKKSNTLIATSQIFNFSDYILQTKQIIQNLDKIISIDVFWEDPLEEIRYGQKKTSNISISSYDDFLPHVLSILRYLIVNDFKSYKILSVEQNNIYQQCVNLKINDILCNFHLKKNSVNRKRLFKFITTKGDVFLDFSNNKARMISNTKKGSNKVNFSMKEGSLKLMLNDFFSSIQSGFVSKKIDIYQSLINYEIISSIKKY